MRAYRWPVSSFLGQLFGQLRFPELALTVVEESGEPAFLCSIEQVAVERIRRAGPLSFVVG